MTVEHALLQALLLASALGCGRQSPQEVPARAPAQAQAAAPSNRIDIPATVRSNLGLTFAQVEVRRVAQTIRVPGAFELRPLARREYRMALRGTVELLVDQYERVTPGQLLFRFRSPAWPELQHEIIVGEQAIETALGEIGVSRAKIDEARAQVALLRGRIAALAQVDFKRADLEAEAAKLAASQPRLEAELRLAQTTLSNARRTREHALHRAATAAGIAEEELVQEVLVGDSKLPMYRTIDWIEVRAAASGLVEELAVTQGAFVEPPSPVLSTVDPEQVRFRALALQADLPQLEGAREARIVPPLSTGIPIGAGVMADMTLGLEAHPRERTLTLLATPRRLESWIRPGVSAFLEVVVATTAAPALAIPRSAILQDGLTHVFFRRNPGDPNQALRVEADMGVSDGRWVAIKSGLMPGDEVVLDGVYELKLALERSGVLGGADASSHVHADGSVHDEH